MYMKQSILVVTMVGGEPTISFTSLTKLRVAIAKIPAYFSPSRTNPNVSLKDCLDLDLASRMFLFLSIVSFSRMPARTSF